MANSKRKVIQKKLNEFKENKKNVLTEERIIKNRLSYIFESSLNDNNLDINDLTTSLISEVAYLKEQGYNDDLITENVGGFFNLLKSAVGGGAFDSFISTIQERVTRKICQLLKIKQTSFFGKLIETTVGNVDGKDLPRLFDCRFIASKITESLPEAFVAHKFTRGVENKGLLGVIASMMRNYVLDNFVNDSKVMDKVEDTIANAICGFLGGMTNKATEKYNQYSQRLKGQTV